MSPDNFMWFATGLTIGVVGMTAISSYLVSRFSKQFQALLLRRMEKDRDDSA